MLDQRRAVRRRWVFVASGVLGALVLVGLGVYLAAVGLDDADKIAGVIGVFIGVLGLLLAIWDTYASRVRSRTATPEIPVSGVSDADNAYVDAFLMVNRCPPWNKDLCSAEQVQAVGINYVLVDDDRAPAFSEFLYKLDHELNGVRYESLPVAAERILASGRRGNITVLLGNPGAGKSSFAVQLAHFVAHQRKQGSGTALPIYVNLAHFTDAYRPTEDGLARLVEDAVSQACPRHQMRTAGTARLRAVGRELLAGHAATPVLVVLDGMDELPAADYPERVEAIARFMDSARPGLVFLVTCRYLDFIRLNDHTTNLLLRRWDLLPWNRHMVRGYLKAIAIDDDVRTAMVKQIDSDDREHYDPLEIALRADVGRSSAGVTLSDAWDRYINVRLAEELQAGFPVGAAIAELGHLAIGQTWPDLSRPVSDLVIDAARRAGLLVKTSDGLVFAIRPLMHHLAGQELWHRTRAGGALPAPVLLEDINARETLKSASSQAGTDPRWTSAVLAALRTPGVKRVHGDRLAAAAHVLTAAQIASDDELAAQLVEIISYLVIVDGVERKRCLSALGEQTALLDPELASTRRLINWIATDGSPGAVTWLLELLARNPALRGRYRDVPRRALSRSLDEGRFGKQVQALASRFLPRSPFVHTALTAARLTLLGVGYYLTYVVAWMAATAVLEPLSEGLGVAFPSFSERWRQQFEFTNLGMQGWRLFYLLFTVLTARKVLRERAAEGLWPQTWSVRYLALVLMVFGVRLGCGVYLLAPEWATRLPVVWMTTGLVLVVAAVFVPQLSRPSGRRGRRRLVVLLRDRRVGERGKPAPDSTGTVAEEIPGARILSLVVPEPEEDRIETMTPTAWMPEVPDDHAARRHGKQDTAALVQIAIAVCVCFVVMLVLGRVDLAMLAVVGGLVTVIVTTVFVGPLRRARDTKEQIRKQVRGGLSSDLRATVAAVFEKIENERLASWIRIAYVDALTEARFDDVLRNRLEALYARLPQGPVHTRLTDVVEQAHHEHRKRGRPGVT